MAELTELENMRISAASEAASARVMRQLGMTTFDGNAVTSLGTGWTYDQNGNVIDPVGGFWKAGMAVGSAPVKG